MTTIGFRAGNLISLPAAAGPEIVDVVCTFRLTSSGKTGKNHICRIRYRVELASAVPLMSFAHFEACQEMPD